MLRNCAKCGKPFDAQRSTATYCGSKCRSSQGGKPSTPVVTMPHLDLSYVQSVENRLREWNLRDDPMGQAALRLAEQASIETGSALASLTRELRATLVELERRAAPVAVDPVDELRARRDAKRATG